MLDNHFEVNYGYLDVCLNKEELEFL